MSLKCDPGTLLSLAKCFLCPTSKPLMAMETYALCQATGTMTSYPPPTNAPAFTILDSTPLGGSGYQFVASNLPNLLTISFPNLTSLGTVNIQRTSALVNLRFPKLVSIGIIQVQFSTTSPVQVFDLSALKTMSVGGGILYFDGAPVTLSLPSLAAGSPLVINGSGPSGQQMVSVVPGPNWSPPHGGQVNLQKNALSAACVNNILARCVADAGFTSGTILLNQGTNAAPTGQGLIDKATLQGRGVTVTTT